MMEIKRGDIVTFKKPIGIIGGCLVYEDSEPAKVMGIVDNYAMLRFPRGMPFVRTVKELTKIEKVAS